MMGFGLIWMLLSWGGFILLAVWLIIVLFPAGSQPSAGNGSNPYGTARDILDQRYARGELSRAQYDEMRRTMGQ